MDDIATTVPDTGDMTFSDYLIDIGLIGLVLLQVRGRRLTTRALVLPLAIVGYVAVTYLRGVPTAGNDLLLVIGCALVGATLGGLSGTCTSVYPDDDGIPMAKAGAAAAGLWILGTGSRLAFQVYATHGGGVAIERFSATHAITTVSACSWRRRPSRPTSTASSPRPPAATGRRPPSTPTATGWPGRGEPGTVSTGAAGSGRSPRAPSGGGAYRWVAGPQYLRGRPRPVVPQAARPPRASADPKATSTSSLVHGSGDIVMK